MLAGLNQKMLFPQPAGNEIQSSRNKKHIYAEQAGVYPDFNPQSQYYLYGLGDFRSGRSMFQIESYQVDLFDDDLEDDDIELY